MVLDVEDRLDARQVRRQRAAVGPAFGSPGPAPFRCALFFCFLAGGLDLLGFLEPEKQLVFGQALGSASKAVALQFLDDLAQPRVLGLMRQHHRLQRVRIVGKLVGRDRHDASDHSIFAADRRLLNAA